MMAVLALASRIQAADKTWNNTGTNFNANGSWSGGAPGIGDAALFDSASITQPQLTASVSVDQLSFSTANASGYNLTSANAGLALTLLSDDSDGFSAIYQAATGMNTIDAALVLGASSGTTQNFTVTAGTLTINGSISSTHDIALHLSGAGTLALNGINSYTGTTTLDPGNVVIGNNAAFGSTRIVWNGGTLSASTDLTNLAALHNSGTFTHSGTTFAGTHSIELEGFQSNAVTHNTITNNIVGGSLIISGLHLSTNATGRTVTFTGPGDTIIGFITDALGAPSRLVYSGSGSLTLTNGNNDYRGGTIINSGTVFAQTDNAFGSGNITLTSPNIAMTLRFGTNKYVGDNAVLSVLSGDVINLDFDGVDVIGGLIVDGTNEPSGLYGFNANNPDGIFTGTGFFRIPSVPEPSIFAMIVAGGCILASAARLRRKTRGQ